MPRIENPNFRAHFLGMLGKWREQLHRLDASRRIQPIWQYETARSAARSRIKFCIFLLNGDYVKAKAEDRKIRELNAAILDSAMFEATPGIAISEETIRTWADRLKADHALRVQELAMLKVCLASGGPDEVQALHELAQTLTPEDVAAIRGH